MHADFSSPRQLILASERCVPEWRLARSWSTAELEDRLGALADCPLSAPESDLAASSDPAFRHYYSEAQIFAQRPGTAVRPGTFELAAAFERASALVTNYEFSDPRIVIGHFDPKAPLLGRPMLLELKALRVLRYLCGVMVRAVRDETQGQRRIFGFRYDTLVGHIEAGSEWFLLTRDDSRAQITFRIQAAWRAGQFPNWWSRLGFHAVGRRYQRAWHRLAHLRMREFLGARTLPPLPGRGRLLHEGRPAEVAPVSDVSRREPPQEIQRERQT